jgi:hypothetical protein
MATRKQPSRKIRQDLEAAVVSPLFESLRPAATVADASVPEVVLEHRRRRARERLLDALVSRGSAKVPPDLQAEVKGLVRRWAAAGFHDGFDEVERFEIRCARDHDRVVAEESGDPERLLDVLDKELRRRVVEQLGRIELRGLQTSHRVLGDLDVMYVPLHLEATPDSSEGESIKILSRPRIEAIQILKENRHALIVGAPGSGKSTLLSYLALGAATGHLSKKLGWSHDPLPLLIRVRALKSASLTSRSLASHVECREELVARALARQQAALFVDGLDEAPPALRGRLADSLRRFVSSHPEIPVVATSRPAGSPGEVERRLHGLQPFRLTDLTRDEVDTFIDKWCLAAEMSVRREPAEAEKEARVAAADLKQRLAASYSVQRIATNPLLVTILCVVHRFQGKTIPEHRVTLYKKCTEALLYEWDRAKFEEGATIGLLDAPAKERLLMEIARRVHDEHAAEIPEQEVVRHFTATLPDLDRPVQDAKRIVTEIRDRSGLLVERRPGFFAFSHLTFQEYLCALDYVRTKDLADLVGHYQEPWWQEVIVLAAGVPGGGGGAIPRRLLTKKHPAAIFLAAQCLETEADMPLAVRERIEKALQRIVPPKNGEDARRLRDIGIVAAPILAKALQTANAEQRAWTLSTLLPMDYDPVLPAIARCVADERPTESHFLTDRDKPLSVGGVATVVLAFKAESSDTARLSLKDAVLQTPLPDLIGLSRQGWPDEVKKILNSALKARSPETSAPKRAKSTA